MENHDPTEDILDPNRPVKVLRRGAHGVPFQDTVTVRGLD